MATLKSIGSIVLVALIPLIPSAILLYLTIVFWPKPVAVKPVVVQRPEWINAVDDRLSEIEAKVNIEPAIISRLDRIQDELAQAGLRPVSAGGNGLNFKQIPYITYEPRSLTTVVDGRTVTTKKWVPVVKEFEVNFSGNWPEELASYRLGLGTNPGVFDCRFATYMAPKDVLTAEIAIKQVALGDEMAAIRSVAEIVDDFSRGHVLGDHIVGALRSPEAFEAALPLAKALRDNPIAKATALSMIATALKSFGSELAQEAFVAAGIARRESWKEQEQIRELSPAPNDTPEPPNTPVPFEFPRAPRQPDIPPELAPSGAPDVDEGSNSFERTRDKQQEGKQPVNENVVNLTSNQGATVSGAAPFYEQPIWYIALAVAAYAFAVVQPICTDAVKVFCGRSLAGIIGVELLHIWDIETRND